MRTRTTADAVVGGVIGPLNAPEALLLGLPDEHGSLRVAGRTASCPDLVLVVIGLRGCSDRS